MASTAQPYGYVSPTYGYMKPPKQPALTLAASGRTTNPFGGRTSTSDPFGLGLNTGSASAAFQGTTVLGPAKTGQAGSVNVPKPPAAPAYPPTAPVPSQTQTPSAAVVNQYDINTDPALQQIQALTGLSDEQAKAQATQQIRDQLLAFGDPTLAGKTELGGDSLLAQAAAQNPTSTRAQLTQQRDRNVKSLDDALNANNLTYSGYRVSQEQQAAQDFQNALAQAAAGVNSNIGQIQGGLNQALSANEQQRAQALFQAELLAAQLAQQFGYDPGTAGDTTDTATGDTSSSGPTQTPRTAPTLAYYAAAPDPNSPLAQARLRGNRGSILF